MKRADELIPWTVTDISFRPYKEMWSFNPSIHFDGAVWRCILRCSDYAMPGGLQIKSRKARSGEAHTKNAMVILDAQRWRPIEIYKIREHDGLPRASCDSVGYEDIRLFSTDKGGLQGIAASLHLQRDPGSRNVLAEQVLLTLDDRYDVVSARPLREASWSRTPQKNWVPYDHCAEPRFLYSIADGTMVDDRGILADADACVCSSARIRRQFTVDDRARRRAHERAEDAQLAAHDRDRDRSRDRDRERRRREWRGRVVDPAPGYGGLRGGTQLARVGDDAWLGIGHAMTLVDGLKYYWHVWYCTDSRGKMLSASPPMKLARNGIEFAAGLVIDGDRIVVSFGVDDMECKIGETKLSAVLGILQKFEPLNTTPEMLCRE